MPLALPRTTPASTSDAGLRVSATAYGGEIEHAVAGGVEAGVDAEDAHGGSRGSRVEGQTVGELLRVVSFASWIHEACRCMCRCTLPAISVGWPSPRAVASMRRRAAAVLVEFEIPEPDHNFALYREVRWLMVQGAISPVAPKAQRLSAQCGEKLIGWAREELVRCLIVLVGECVNEIAWPLTRAIRPRHTQWRSKSSE